MAPLWALTFSPGERHRALWAPILWFRFDLCYEKSRFSTKNIKPFYSASDGLSPHLSQKRLKYDASWEKNFTKFFSFVLKNNVCVYGMLDVNDNTIRIHNCTIQYKNNRRDGPTCWTCLFRDGTRGLVMPYNYIISRRHICRLFFLNVLVQKGMLIHLPHVLLKSTDTKEWVETFASCSLKKYWYKPIGWHTRIF